MENILIIGPESIATVEVNACPRNGVDSEKMERQVSEMLKEAAATYGKLTDAVFMLSDDTRYMGLIQVIGKPGIGIYVTAARKMAEIHGATSIMLVVSGLMGLRKGDCNPSENVFSGGTIISQLERGGTVTIRALRIKTGACGTKHFVVEQDSDKLELPSTVAGVDLLPTRPE